MLMLQRLLVEDPRKRLGLAGVPLREDMMDVIRTLRSYDIVGETALTMMQVDAAKKLRDALQIEAERSVRAAIEPCAEPVRMMLRKYHQKNGVAPARIIIFRDGVGDAMRD